MVQRDLFDQAGAKQSAGNRQCDIEDVIFEKSLAALIASGDEDGRKDWVAQAKAGKVMRIM